MQGPVTHTRTRLRRLAWVALGYTVLVILFGAVVRITGSGAGCGQHWPTCHGELVPLSPTLDTVIEFSHRLTSGLCGLFVLALLIAALRVLPRGHLGRLGAWLSLLFTVTEALLGAGLVLFGLVADDDSAARALVMAAHLVNTSFLTASLASVVWATGPTDLAAPPASRRTIGLTLIALVGLLLVGVSGAVTALGDTLFPVQAGDLAARIERDFGAGAHFLQRLRLLHPLLACGLGLFAGVIAYGLSGARGAGPSVRAWGNATAALIALQLVAGVVNVLLSAPGWMQVLHLALGTVLWIAAFMFTLHVARAGRMS